MKHHPSHEILKDLVIRNELKGFSVEVEFMHIKLILDPIIKNKNIQETLEEYLRNYAYLDGYYHFTISDKNNIGINAELSYTGGDDETEIGISLVGCILNWIINNHKVKIEVKDLYIDLNASWSNQNAEHIKITNPDIYYLDEEDNEIHLENDSAISEVISKKLIEIMHEFYPSVEKTSFNINIEENISSVQFEGTEIIKIN